MSNLSEGAPVPANEPPGILDAVKSQNGQTHYKFGTASSAVWFSTSDLIENDKNVFSRLAAAGMTYLTTSKRNSVKKIVEEHLHFRDGLIASRPGWLTDNIYVFGDGSICRADGAATEIIVTFDTNERHTPVGTLAEWKAQLSAIGGKEPITLFLQAYALLGPLLRFAPSHVLNPYIELIGEPESGKTTFAMLAASVHAGDPSSGIGGGVTWNLSEASFDQLRKPYNDSMLFIDEQNEMDISLQISGKMAFKQASSSGRRKFDHPPAESLRMALLSTGNVSTRDGMKGPDGVARAVASRTCEVSFQGPLMREVPAGYPDTMSATNHIRVICNQQYGTAGRAFIQEVATAVAQDPVRFRSRIVSLMTAFRAKIGNGALPSRIVDTFSITYAAGFMAKKWGILPDNDASVMNSCIYALQLVPKVGSPQAVVQNSATEVIKEVLRAKGRSVFDLGSSAAPKHRVPFETDFGYRWTSQHGETFYYIETSKLREISTDLSRVLKDLRAQGALITEKGRNPKLSIKAPRYIPVSGRRVYCLKIGDPLL
ncbi:DUF927 domain-containing protein [Mesorhizobium sp. AR10]|uniref:DUF927 domain-containing protein n=1 Tax=Mesorhizobium sp. AR10 TaxID=2865839 RepID=UPI00215E997C|nr:DUF927 domain-containing protein [Mesorhizobium sp. AR10]UVK39366.1 DUF927 domain-containing protein [Mesorhizobium sp. AR10]